MSAKYKNGNGSDPDVRLLTPELHDVLRGIGVPVIFRAGSVLYTEGQLRQRIVFINSGRVKLIRTSPHGKTLLVRIARPQEILGLSAVLMRVPHIMTAETIETTHITLFEAKDFLRLMRSNVELSIFAARSISQAYHATIDEAYRLALSTSVASRLANLLLDFFSHNEKSVGDDGELAMPLRHEDLAFMTGTSRESVTRTLNDFKRKGIISVKGTNITILQLDELELLV